MKVLVAEDDAVTRVALEGTLNRCGHEPVIAGVDDFVTKPYDPEELEARLHVAERILGLHTELDQLASLLPICAYCKNIQDNRTQWVTVERYVTEHTRADLTHTICPSCYETEVKPELEEWKRTRADRSQP